MAVCVSVAASNELVAQLVKFFNGLRGEDNSAEEQKLVKAGKVADLLVSLVPDFKLAFKSNTPSIEGGFNLFCCVLKESTKDSEVLQSIYASVLEQVLLDPEDRPLLRIKLLNNIFNSQEIPQIRFKAFCGICDLTKLSNNPDLLLPQLSKIQKWIQTWGLDTEQTRELYRALYLNFAKSQKQQLVYYKYLLAYLKTFDAGGAGGVADEAVSAVVLAAKLLEVRDFDAVVGLKAVEALKGHGKYGSHFELLEILARGNVHDYMAFEEKASAALGDLSKEDLLVKIRLLTLASIGNKNTHIGFAQISQELKVSIDDVELWVLEAIKNKYIDAKIDELEDTVIIQQSHFRLFGKNEWKDLQEELRKTQVNLRQVSLALDKNVSQQRLVGK